jgi:hypothetical protein
MFSVDEIYCLRIKKIGCKNCTKVKERGVRKYYIRGNNKTEENRRMQQQREQHNLSGIETGSGETK